MADLSITWFLPQGVSLLFCPPDKKPLTIDHLSSQLVHNWIVKQVSQLAISNGFSLPLRTARRIEPKKKKKNEIWLTSTNCAFCPFEWKVGNFPKFKIAAINRCDEASTARNFVHRLSSIAEQLAAYEMRPPSFG